MMRVRGAWYPNGSPKLVVVELMDGATKAFFHAPFRGITEDDLRDYRLRKDAATPIPEHVARFYGLELAQDA